jgi:hypothetical protein
MIEHWGLEGAHRGLLLNMPAGSRSRTWCVSVDCSIVSVSLDARKESPKELRYPQARDRSTN